MDSVRTSAGGWQRDTVFHRVRPFRLRSAAGRAVAAAELGQGLYVVQFFSAGEPAAEVTRYLARLQEKFRQEPRVRLATLVAAPVGEPASQTNATLGKLSEQYGTTSGKWFFLASSADTLSQLARQEFGLTALRPGHLPFRPATEPEGQVPLGRLVLFDNDLHVVGYYDGTYIHEI